MSTNFNLIPHDVKALIFVKLGGVTDISKVSQVCKSWHKVVTEIINRIGKQLSLTPITPGSLITTRQIIDHVKDLHERIAKLGVKPTTHIQTLLEKKGALIRTEITTLKHAPSYSSSISDYFKTINTLFVSKSHPAHPFPYSECDREHFLHNGKTIPQALKVFARILSPITQMNIFAYILSADNSTDDIARQFYNILPPDMQEQFRYHIWLANSKSDDGHGIAYGEHMIAHAIRAPVCLEAAKNYGAALALCNK